jgi:hypothetical protein
MRPLSISLASILLLVAGAGHAADFQKLDDGGVRHANSGWLFSKNIGDYARVGEPEGVAGGSDGVANYERPGSGSRVSATIYVYSSDTRALDASLDGAKAMIVSKLKSEFLAQSWSEGPFRVGTTPSLVGEKAFYKVGLGPASWQSNLYYFDTGKWVVKIRMTTEKTDKDNFNTLDAFVRALPWESLGLTADTCSGSACKVNRPLPTHGAIPEQLAILFMTTRQLEIYPRDMPACEQATLEPALMAPSPSHVSGESAPVQVVASCAPSKKMRASFVRFSLSSDIRDKLEKEAPDGLSLRDPITFVILSDGKSSILTQMYDGALDGPTVRRMLQALSLDKHLIFGKGDKHGKNPKPVMRDLEGLAEFGG